MTAADGLVSGRYRMGELLGTGGSASVFAAVDTTDGSELALKVLHPHLSESPALRDAFFDEARRAEALRHPNVVAVLGTGLHESAGTTIAWIALERVRGVSLAERVARRGPLEVRAAIAVADGVLAGLEAAHAIGLMHRDVSPANVMIADGSGAGGGRVQLVDFGLADAAGRASIGSDILRSASPGDRAGVVGSVGYMSPEQIRGEPIDERGDVYQAGGVLYFALTGREPFPRSSVEATVRAHLDAPPPVPSVARPGVSRELDRVVVRALLKDPDDRFASATAMRAALAEALENLPVAAPVRREVDGATRLLGSTSVPGRSADDTRTAIHGASERGARSTTNAADPRSRVGAWTAVALAVAAAAAVVVFAALAPPAAVVPTPVATAPVTSAPVAAPEPVVTEPESVVAVVPELVGARLGDARAAVEAAGLVLGAISVVDGAQAGDTVLASAPGAGARLDEGAVVELTVASGSNAVPDVVGRSSANALTLLQGAGFSTEVVAVETSEALPGSILRMEPAAGVVLRLGSVVRIVEASAPATPPTPTGPPAPTTAPPTSTPEPTEPATDRGVVMRSPVLLRPDDALR
ncbi:protein kinase [Agromyces atrinae]|uniref:protein kinase domain-containing protein n=1 Tax=Agromyces atrinae TaxID=592376 RepID=UPI001F5791BC|nr:PASTA domain-containing protein [Agromyces atrinae]MCI2956339.1 protein kinase [Agromyces atrinae]